MEDSLVRVHDSRGAFSVRSASKAEWHRHIQSRITQNAGGYDQYDSLKVQDRLWKAIWKLGEFADGVISAMKELNRLPISYSNVYYYILEECLDELWGGDLPGELHRNLVGREDEEWSGIINAIADGPSGDTVFSMVWYLGDEK